MAMLAVLEGAFCAGTAMGTASILSVGPNNMMLMREGLVRGRVSLVASTVLASYSVLLLAALVLTDRIATQGCLIRPVLSWLGLLAIAWFAYAALRSWFRQTARYEDRTVGRETVASCICRVLAVVWLNPLTYIELLLIPASMSSNFVIPASRFMFISGLIMMATVACFGYSFGAGLCAPIFRRKSIVRMFDLGSGVILSCMACIMAVTLVCSWG